MRLTGNQLLIYITLCHLVNSGQHVICHRDIADLTGLSWRTVHNHLSALAACGVVCREKTSMAGQRGQVYRYAVGETMTDIQMN